MAYLLKYDSSHGKLNKDIRIVGSDLIIDGHKVRVSEEFSPGQIPWRESGVETVLECTGKFLSKKLS